MRELKGLALICLPLSLYLSVPLQSVMASPQVASPQVASPQVASPQIVAEQSPQTDVPKLLTERIETSSIAEAPSSASVLDDLDRAILLECIKFSRFNLTFHQMANRHSSLLTFAYPIEQEAGTSLSLASSIIDLHQRIRGYKTPSRKSKSAARTREVCALVGNCIGSASSAIQLGQNAIVDLASRNAGFAPAARIRSASQMVSTIDQLIAKRDQDVLSDTEASPQQKRIREIEGLLMKHIRNQLLTEFRKWSTYSEEYMTKESTSYAINSLQNMAQAGSSILNLRAFKNRQLAGGSSILSLSAGFVGAFNPTLSWLAGRTARMHHRHQLDKAFPDSNHVAEESPVEWKKEREDLVAAGVEANDIREAAFLAANSQEQDEALIRELTKIDKLRRVAAQQSISAPIIGMTSVAKSTLSTIGYYGYRQDSVTRNKIGLAGRITNMSGQSYSLMRTATTQVHSILNQRRLKSEGRLPAQIAAERFRKLDALEAQVKSGRLKVPSSKKSGV